jgi:hypothetical protein
MTKLHFWQRVAVVIGLMAALGTAYAADVNGRIKGVVTDPQGAVVAGVRITATNAATGIKFDTVSASDGVYLFPDLPVGTYSITATAPAFKTFTANGITLDIDQEYEEAVHLTVGSQTEVVQVNAAAVQVDTSQMQLSNVINSQQMEELPLIGRNFTGLELTLPGVQASSDRFGTYSVSGAQTQQSSFLINGADTNDIALNTLAIAPNLDAIDQFNLIEGPLNAEYDRNSGGIVSATIKEGTNHIHGDAFEFYRDTFLNTANFYQHTLAGVPEVSKYHQNIPGGTIGGPIMKDKLFFFGAYQRTSQITPQSGGRSQPRSYRYVGRVYGDTDSVDHRHPRLRWRYMGTVRLREWRRVPVVRNQPDRQDSFVEVHSGSEQRHLRLRIQPDGTGDDQPVHWPDRLLSEPAESVLRDLHRSQSDRDGNPAVYGRHAAGFRRRGYREHPADHIRLCPPVQPNAGE